VRAYLAVLLAQEVVDAGERKLATANLDVAATDAQSKAQLVSSNDVTRAEITRASTERDLASDRGSLDVAYVQLAFTINSPVARGLATPTALLAAGELPIAPAAIDGLVAQSIAHRPDLFAHKDTALAAHDFAREPHLRFYPTLNLVGQMTATSDAATGAHAVDGSVALTASWSIYDAGNRDADERARDAAAAIADLNTDTLVRTIDQQVRTAVAQLTAAQQSLVGAKDAMDASRKSALETKTLYDQGLAKAIELVDANESRFEAEVAYAEAEYAVANAYLALRQAMGDGPLLEAR
jgi:outer membrane protein TolC